MQGIALGCRIDERGSEWECRSRGSHSGVLQCKTNKGPRIQSAYRAAKEEVGKKGERRRGSRVVRKFHRVENSVLDPK